MNVWCCAGSGAPSLSDAAVADLLGVLPPLSMSLGVMLAGQLAPLAPPEITIAVLVAGAALVLPVVVAALAAAEAVLPALAPSEAGTASSPGFELCRARFCIRRRYFCR
mmetsp:Transcript_41277/g.96479  ORF Transcript_41277/g.96479 Transcript_41277/m.96479 type:complete len:109 (-) Transcript_41277:911-1237(-)